MTDELPVMRASDYSSINPQLLFRLWKKKGCIGIFEYQEYGVSMRVFDCGFGLVRVVNHPLLLSHPLLDKFPQVRKELKKVLSPVVGMKEM